jgi:hypothetical protein
VPGLQAVDRGAILAERRRQGAARADAALVKDAQEHAEAHRPARGRALLGDRDENIRWIKAYIVHTADRLDLQGLHDDAQRYLDELEGHAHRWPDQREAEALKPFMPR